MKRADLKTGAIVQMRDNRKYILIGRRFIDLGDENRIVLLAYYDDNLRMEDDEYSLDDYDIMKCGSLIVLTFILEDILMEI